VLPWYSQPRFRLAGAALLAGLVIGGLLTVALGYQSAPKQVLDRSAAEAIASDHAAVAKPAATTTPVARKIAAKATKRAKHAKAVVITAAAKPAATSTPKDEEHGENAASTPAPSRSTPRRQTQRVVSKPRTQITPVTKKKTPAKSTPAPKPTAPVATPAPTAAPQAPAPTATPNPPHRPPTGHPGGGDDDDPGQP
jgi:hypothetical protein